MCLGGWWRRNPGRRTVRRQRREAEISHKVILDNPEGPYSALRQDLEGSVHKMRLTAAVAWYEMGLIAHGKAAEIAGLSQSDLIQVGHDVSHREQPHCGHREAYADEELGNAERVARRSGIDVGADEALEARLYGRPEAESQRQRPQPDCAYLHAERRKPGVTLELLHIEYLEQHPDGSRYTRLYELYRRWIQRRGLSMRQAHRAGEKCFVDCAGYGA
jgi:Uncharacterised protein family (UPF0175)